jgi:hypothetical protein
MNESTARRNLFTLLKFDIKGFINPSSIKLSALTIINTTTNDVFSSLTTKRELEDNLLLRNHKAYRASGSTPFGHNALGHQLIYTGDSPLDESILDGSFTHSNPEILAVTSNLQRRPSLPYIPPAKISE